MACEEVTPSPINSISAEHVTERNVIRVQMHLNDVPGQWIEFNAPQLEELIKLLLAHYIMIAPPPPKENAK